MSLKETLISTRLGGQLLSGRDKLQLLSSSFQNMEELGTLVNDQMAATLVCGLCLPEKVFVDVGAHIGSITAEVARRVPGAKIIAVEAIPWKVANLRKRFPQVQLLECAAGEENTRISFFVDKQQSGYSTLGKRTDVASDRQEEIRVDLKRLDDLIGQEPVDVMKIDVEGAELGVLRGSARLLQQHRPIVMFESAPQRDDGLGYTKEMMHAHFAGIGYVIVAPNRLGHNDDGMELSEFLRSHLYPRVTTNYFAVPKERRQEYRLRARRVLGFAGD